MLEGINMDQGQILKDGGQFESKGNCEVDCEIDCEADIYAIGGYDRVINKLRAKFVNMVSDEKGYKGFVGKDRVFILTGYVSHADIYKIESLGIDGKFVNSKGINCIVREIEGCVRRDRQGLVAKREYLY